MPSVLLIDDDPAALATLERVLRETGFDVALATTGREGLTVVRQRAIDFAVADLWLADMSGLEVLRQLRQEVTHVPFVVIVDFAATAAALEAEEGSKSPKNSQVIHAVSVIEKRFSETNLSVRSVAHDIGVSTEHLCRLLKRQTGQTFVTLLRGQRVRAACELLSSTTLSMKEIAGQAGFGNASRFARDFKKLRGVAPSEYRTRGVARPSIARARINFRQAISTNRKP